MKPSCHDNLTHLFLTPAHILLLRTSMMDAALCEILVVNVRQPMDAVTYPFPREASQLHFRISSWITISLNGFWTRLDA